MSSETLVPPELPPCAVDMPVRKQLEALFQLLGKVLGHVPSATQAPGEKPPRKKQTCRRCGPHVLRRGHVCPNKPAKQPKPPAAAEPEPLPEPLTKRPRIDEEAESGAAPAPVPLKPRLVYVVPVQNSP